LKRFSLSSNERIKKRKDFELIFSTGRFVYSSGKVLRAHYLIENGTDDQVVIIAPVVVKKLGNAVWRNRVKRLIKESYRLNKEILTEVSLRKNVLLKVIFSPNILNEEKNKHLSCKEISPHIVDIMLKIAGRL
jgi:ribonuclease P protein component